MDRLTGLRNRKQALKVVKELDAFPKIPESYKETTSAGGGVSILVFICIAVLVVSEIWYYSATQLKFNYEVDTAYEGKLKINVDITVAMKCEHIGADVLDLTGQNVDSFGSLKEEAVHFELSPNQKQYAEILQHMNEYITQEYHAIHDVLWKSGYSALPHHMPERETPPEGPPDGCRVSGTLEVNKVAGNFHITAGKSIPVFPRGHAHLAMTVKDKDYNFSHRIHTFSFGEPSPGIVNPLDGDEKVTDNNYHMFQYFVQVVPTSVNTRRSKVDTYQYAVTERNRSIDHSKGSHGVPGIFVKYDLSSIKIAVREERKPYWQFLVRLCGIVGGIFATSGILHNIMGFTVDLFCCRLKIGKYDTSSNRAPTAAPAQPVPFTDLTPSPSTSFTSVNLLAQDNNSVSTPSLHPVTG